MTYRSMAIALLLAAASASACGGGKAARVESFDGIVAGELVRVEGTLSLRGSHPFPMLVLALNDRESVIIESKTIQSELKSLSGLDVSVEGEVMPPPDEVDMPVLNVLRYELLRLPSGEVPVVGAVSMEDGKCVLTTSMGKRYWIRGDLEGVVSDYAGSRVWVVGKLGDAALPDRPSGSVPYWVTGYGVIEETPR